MLDRLPKNERAAWQALWRDVDELPKRLVEKNAPIKGRKNRRHRRPSRRAAPYRRPVQRVTKQIQVSTLIRRKDAARESPCDGTRQVVATGGRRRSLLPVIFIPYALAC